MSQITETYEWTLKSGKKVVATASLKLKETHYADGDNIEVDCCKESFDVEVEGMGSMGSWIKRVGGTTGGVEYAATIGRLAVPAEHLAGIDAIITKIKNHPKKVERREREAKNHKELAQLDARRRANGYCTKCHTYCHGDCQA